MRAPAGMLNVLRLGFLAAAAVGMTITVIRLWPEVQPALASIGWPALLLSSLLALGWQVVGLLGWRATLNELGSPLPVRPAAGIYLISQLGKYIPGSVWAALAMVRLGHEAGLPRSRMAYSFAVSLAFSLLTGLALGIPSLVGRDDDYVWWALAAFLVLAPVLLWPRLLNGVLGLGLRALGRGRLEQPIRGAGILRILGWYLLTWLMGGLHIMVLTVALGADPAEALLPSIAAFAVSSALGVLFVLAPAGAGVRDVLMVVLLADLVGVGGATAIALISRITSLVWDLGGAGVAALLWQGVRRPPQRPEAMAGAPRVEEEH
jgi:glycosyltransferase 2 family protein